MFAKLMPHGMCYVWRPDILWLHVLADTGIVLSYLSIPAMLFYFYRRRATMPYRGLVMMFSLFILACGLTHLMSIWIIWNGHYGAQGILKAITAIVSVITAIMLYFHMPRIMSLRTSDELEALNKILKHEIKERKRQELQTAQLQKELVHASRVNSMGQLATGLAHELNQPLTAITQYVDAAHVSLQSTTVDNKQQHKLIQQIDNEARRAAGIIKSIRQFIKKDESRRSVVDLKALIKQSVQLLVHESRSAGVNIIVDTHCNDKIIVDRVQITQVILNLIRNSIDAIRLNSSPVKEIDVSARTEGNQMVVTIKDTGPGMPSDLGA